jgi:hypothetical protein
LVLDSTFSQEVRELASRELEEERVFDHWSWLEGVLLSAPLPDGSDIAGARRFLQTRRALFDRLERAQPASRMLLTCWHALPYATFPFSSLADVVRRGLFGQLIGEGGLSRRTPFSPALDYYSSCLTHLTKTHAPSIGESHIALWSHGPNQQDVANDIAVRLCEIAPWRTAWLSLEWPRFESKIAGLAAEELIRSSRPFLFIPVSAKVSRDIVTRLFRNWERKRHDSTLSQWVDIIRILPSLEARDSFMQQLSLSDPKSGHRRMVDLPSTATAAFAKLLVHFFDLGAKSIAQLVSILSIDNPFEAYETDLVLLTLAREEVERTLTVRPPKELRRFVTSEFSLEQAELGFPRVDHSGQVRLLKEVLCIYALDRVFEKDGGIVHILDDRRQDYLNPIRMAFVCNPVKKKSFHVQGRLAVMLKVLGARLQADLASGLNVEHCGWSPLDALSKDMGRRRKMILKDVRDLRQLVIEAGLAAEIIERHSDRIRLNPQFVAPANSSFPADQD